MITYTIIKRSRQIKIIRAFLATFLFLSLLLVYLDLEEAICY